MKSHMVQPHLRPSNTLMACGETIRMHRPGGAPKAWEHPTRKAAERIGSQEICCRETRKHIRPRYLDVCEHEDVGSHRAVFQTRHLA